MRSVIIAAVLLLSLISVASADTISLQIPSTVVKDHNFNANVQVLISSGHTYRVIFIVDSVQIITNTFNLSTEPSNGIFTFEIAIPDSGSYIAYAKLERDGVVIAQDQATVLVVDISEIEQRLSSVESEIVLIESNISSMEQQISTNTASIADLQQSVDDISNRVSTLEANISDIYAQIQDIKSNIAQLNTSVDDLQSRISNLETTVTSIQSQLQTLDSQVSDLESRVSVLEQKVSNLEVSVSNIQSWMDSTSQVLTDLAVNDTQLKSDIDMLNTTVQSLKDLHDKDIADINTQISNLNSVILQLQIDLSNYKDYTNGTINKLVTDIDELRLDLQSNYNALMDEIAAIKSDISSIKNNVSELQSGLNEVSKKTNDTSSRVDIMEELFKLEFDANDIYGAFMNLKDTITDLIEKTSQLASGQESINKTIDSIKANVTNLETQVIYLKQNIMRIEKEFNDYKTTTQHEIGDLKTKVKNLQDENDRLKQIINELLKPQHISVSREADKLLVKVTTYDDMPVSGADITITANNTVIHGKTDSDGIFSFNITENGLTSNQEITVMSKHLGYVNASANFTIPSANVKVPGFEAATSVVGILAALLIIRRFKP